MKNTNLLESRGALLLVYVGIPVAMISLGLVTWISAHPYEPSAPIPATGVKQSGKHFTGTVHFDLLAKLLADDRRSKPADVLLQRADSQAAYRVQTCPHPLLGRPAPDFTLRDHRDQPWNLQGQLGHGPVVLVFYLGNACTACMHNLFELNADIDRFHHLGAEVVAISGDAPARTRRRYEQFGSSAFPVLADPGHVIARAYDALRLAHAMEPEEILHATFVVGRDGRIRWASSGDVPFRNNEALLYELASMGGE